MVGITRSPHGPCLCFQTTAVLVVRTDELGRRINSYKDMALPVGSDCSSFTCKFFIGSFWWRAEHSTFGSGHARAIGFRCCDCGTRVSERNVEPA